MKLVCVSDTHGILGDPRGPVLPPGDTLVIAGDVLRNFDWGKMVDAQRQLTYLHQVFVPRLERISATYKHIVLIPGNHDKCFELFEEPSRAALRHIDNLNLLIDQEVVLDGIKFYGSPWTPWFGGEVWCFNFPDHNRNPARARAHARACWELIPHDVDVLITHGPPHGIGDKLDTGEHVGCPWLLEALGALSPQVHIFGHIHEGYGKYPANSRGTKFVNPSIMTGAYLPSNNPIVTHVTPRDAK